MASVGLGVAVYGFSPAPRAFDIFGTAAHAQVNQAASNVAQPASFADMVERVKPSVISVKVTMKKATDASEKSNDEGSGSPMERFFHQFGGPDGVPQKRGHDGRHRGMMGQGSGFFISSDGYAVTNNHVVEGADKVEVTTDEGKTYTAKVIGTDSRTDLALIKVEGGSDFPFASCLKARPESAIGCLRSAIRLASVAPSRQVSCRPAVATSAVVHMTISFKSTRQSTKVTRVARLSTCRAKSLA